MGNDTNWQTVAAGWGYNVALRTDGTLWAWGNNYDGQLGIGTFTTNAPYGTNTPQRIGSDTNWQAVAAAYSHTLALRTDGTLWAWGGNGFGQLGIGSNTNSNTPQRIGTNADWHAVAAGAYHTMALRADGTLWAWGINDNGQLGNGTFGGSTNTPQQVGTNADWRAITAGERHTVALRAGGTLWAWGRNLRGQLGIGTFNTNAPYGINTPQRIGSDTNWQAFAARHHTMALRTDGTLWAWGWNFFGQLGIGTFSTNAPYGMSTPQQVGTNTNW